jgi:hypothetical protein
MEAMVERSELSSENGGRGGTARRRWAKPGHDVVREGAKELRGGERELLLVKKKDGRSREIVMPANSDELQRTPTRHARPNRPSPW